MILVILNSLLLIGQECNFKTNEIDEFTNIEKKITQSELYITHTDSALLKYYNKKNRSYFELSVNSAKINGLKVIYVTIRIDSDKAYKYYGSIAKDAKFIFKLTNGNTITLKSGAYDFGDTNHNGGYTLYSTYLLLDEDNYKSLVETSVDKVRIYWGEGYQDYLVDDPNVLIQQLNCIN